MIAMQEKQYQSQKEINRLLNKYITCLDLYFHALHEACQKAQKSPTLQYHIDTSSVEVIERFIIIGRKIQHLLQNLQKKL